jgi:hypothetical protein
VNDFPGGENLSDFKGFFDALLALTCPNIPTPALDSPHRAHAMSVLTNYVERLVQSLERNQAILEKGIGEFEDLCHRGVELGNATVLYEAEELFKRALARLAEIDQAKLVLCAPKYRGLVSRLRQRETILLTIRGRYYQAYGRIEQWRRNDSREKQPEPARRQDRAMPFDSAHRVDALHELVINQQRSADGVAMAVSFIVIDGDPRTLREISLDGSGLGPRHLIEQTAATEVRVALHHPAALSSDVIEKIVVKRFLSGGGYRVRAVIYRLSVPEDLHSPFVPTIRLNLPRVGNLEVLTLNPVEVGGGLAGSLA